MSKKQVALFVVAGILGLCAAVGCISAVVVIWRAPDDATRAFGLVIICLVFCLCLAAGGSLWYAGETRWKARPTESIASNAFVLLEDDKHGLLTDDEPSSPAIPVTAVTLATSDILPEKK
jgi:hypothetical protein